MTREERETAVRTARLCHARIARDAADDRRSGRETPEHKAARLDYEHAVSLEDRLREESRRLGDDLESVLEQVGKASRDVVARLKDLKRIEATEAGQDWEDTCDD